MGRMYDAFVEVGPRFTGFGDIKKQGDAAGKEYGEALAKAAAKAAQANIRRLGEALAKARSGEADAAGKVRVAEQKLAETRAQSNAKLSQITAAEEALAAAQRKSAAAAGTAKSAAEALEKGRERAARAADDVGKNAGGRFTKALRGAMSKSDKDGARVATRFGVGFNGVIGGIVSRSAGIFAAGFAGVKAVGLLKAAGELDTKFREVVTLFGDTGTAADKTLGEMSSGVKDLSNQFGIAQTTLTQGLYNAISAGVPKKNVFTFMQVASKASIAGVTDVNTAVDGLSTVINAYGLKASDAQAVSDSLFGAVKGGKTTFRELSDSMFNVGPAAAAAGVSIQETAAAIATLTAGGTPTSVATTQIRSALAGLQRPSAALDKIFQSLGFKNAQLAIKSKGLGFALDAVKKSTKGNNGELQNLLGSTEAVSAANVIAGTGAAKFATEMERQKNAAGSTNDAFGVLSKGVGRQFAILKENAKNLGLSFAQFILPGLNKIATGLTTKVLPGFSALVSAFKGEGVTSDGFVGVMERIGVKAREVFDYFKVEVLPRLKDFAGFIIGTVVPAVATLAMNLASTFGPVVKDIFGFFKTEVLPRLKDFAGFIGDKILPKLGAMAVSLSKNKDFLVPFVGTILAVIAGMKAWAVIQAILNAELFANPIGLVVLAIAALVGGLVWAYKNSETFRKIVDGALKGVAAAGKFMWEIVLHPMLLSFMAVLQQVWKQAQTFAGIVAAAWGAIKEPARIAIKFVVDQFLNMVDLVLRGAAKAFGWVPGLGDKLKTAASEFRKFRDSVNNALDGVRDQAVNIAIKYSSTGVNLTSPSSVGRRATGGPGGPVDGPGTTTSDEAGLFRLSRKEWVIKAKSSMKYGDHAMASVNAGTATIIPGFAKGGSPGLNVHGDFADTGVLARSVSLNVDKMATAVGKALAKSSPLGGPPGAIERFRGQLLNTRTIRMLQQAEGILGRIFHITQGSYSTRVAASGSTHAGGGAMDTDGPGGWDRAVAALRKAGFASWHRTPAQGPWGHHIHSIAIGDSSASPAAKAQVRDFLRGGDGLGGGMALGGRAVRKYDTGGMWPPGTFGYNGTGKTETVRTAEQESRLGGPLQVRVFIGSRELTDIVRVEIDEKNRRAANSYNL